MTDVVISPLAELDLAEIIEFIAQDDPTAARRVLAGFRGALNALAERPEIGHRRDDLASGRELRFWRIFSYLIVYESMPETLRVVRVLSGHRDVEAILAEPSES